jgi:hypothetical protein
MNTVRRVSYIFLCIVPFCCGLSDLSRDCGVCGFPWPSPMAWARAARAFMIVSFVALLFLVIRGVQYPDGRALSAPWYTSPGFVVGIPAVPFIMPFLFGVVLLRRAGKEEP